jgi:signal peptidase I
MKTRSPKKEPKGSFFSKLWYFIWKDDSIWSLLFDLVLAFVLVKFVIYPALEFGLDTSFPVVAVLTSSMEHHPQKGNRLCGKHVEDYNGTFENYWEVCGEWYENHNISKEEFKEYPFHNGFNIGDILLIKGSPVEDYKVGDVAVFWADLEYPIIHRVVKVNEERKILSTKGDQNGGQLNHEQEIDKERVLGKAFFRIPYLGYIKVWASQLVSKIKSTNTNEGNQPNLIINQP